MKITVLAGDGIGPEITDAALVVLKRRPRSLGWIFPMTISLWGLRL